MCTLHRCICIGDCHQMAVKGSRLQDTRSFRIINLSRQFTGILVIKLCHICYHVRFCQLLQLCTVYNQNIRQITRGNGNIQFLCIGIIVKTASDRPGITDVNPQIIGIQVQPPVAVDGLPRSLRQNIVIQIIIHRTCKCHTDRWIILSKWIRALRSSGAVPCRCSTRFTCCTCRR